ncbi:hypothetical protein [Streptomyces sp. NPDC007929]|uniref:hypothetical protein n=1 Tax=unclassified Streptomyces TaxID=2593676 RepID=UPI0036E00552
MTRDELIRPVPALPKEHAEPAPERVAHADSARGATFARPGARHPRALAGVPHHPRSWTPSRPTS